MGAIGVFQTMNGAASALWGSEAVGGVINVVTKSGTNRYRGSAFEYVRDKSMNAKDWGAVLDKPPFKRNQFGATLGGPLQHDRTFFFVTYSGLRQNTSTFLNTATVPTER